MTIQTLWNYCKFVAAAGGTGTFTVAGAAPADLVGPHDVPANCRAVNGNQYRYYAQSPDGTQTEAGVGIYNSGTLTRPIVFGNSDGTTSPHNFTVPPFVDVFPVPTNTLGQFLTDTFPSGTEMLFRNASVPPGWVKQTAFNDWAIRVVNGAGGSGGGVNSFSFTFSYRTSDPTTLSVAQLAQHAHSYNQTIIQGFDPQMSAGPDDAAITTGQSTGLTGSNAAHQHTYDMRVLYLDFLIGIKS